MIDTTAMLNDASAATLRSVRDYGDERLHMDRLAAYVRTLVAERGEAVKTEQERIAEQLDMMAVTAAGLGTTYGPEALHGLAAAIRGATSTTRNFPDVIRAKAAADPALAEAIEWAKEVHDLEAERDTLLARVGRLEKQAAIDLRAAQSLLPTANSVGAMAVVVGAERDRLRKQLPEGMEECTIQFKECPKGHGWLTAANWVQHDCPTCERDSLRRDVNTLNELVRLTGTGQGAIDEAAANIEELDTLRGLLREALKTCVFRDWECTLKQRITEALVPDKKGG